MANKMDLDENGSSASLLRETDEEKLSKYPDDRTPEFEDKTSEEIIHEIRVHQVEMEMQNEEIKRLQFELEVSKDKYQDIYDVVPVGSVDIYHSDGSMRLLQEMKIWMPPRY